MAFRLVYVVLEPPLAGALAGAARRAAAAAGLELAVRGFLLHDLAGPAARAELQAALAEADLFLGAVLTLDAEVQALAELVRARRPPVVAVFHSQVEALLLSRMGDFDGLACREDGSLQALLAHIHGQGVPLPGLPNVVLAALPQLLPVLPPDRFAGFRAYARGAQLWTEGTELALAALLLHLLNQLPAVGGRLPVPAVPALPQVGLWHPAAGQAFTDLAAYQAWLRGHLPDLAGRPAVAVVAHRRWVAAGDTAHFAAAIAALEGEGLAPYPAFSDLDVGPLVEQFWAPVQALVLLNLTAFNLAGGHGRPSPERAAAALARLDAPALAPVPVLFQSLEQWQAGSRGLTAPQLVMQVVMPELEGALEPWPYAGTGPDGTTVPLPAAVARLARRVRRWADLRQTPPAGRRVAVTLFSNPPGKGALGTAAYLDVFRSLWHLLRDLQSAGYTVDLPATPDDLLRACIGGPESRHGSGDLPLAGRVSLAEYRRWVPEWPRSARCWGAPPGDLDSDGRDLLVFGRAFGNVFVGVQPSFGYEGDPMRLLFNPDFAPSHAFAAYYAWLRHRWGAHALLHFGTHGALEFMPGKQVGLAPDDWPAVLLGDLPHIYYYAVNNPSEASIAKRRGGAVTVGYATPPMAQAGLYRALQDLQDTLRAYREAESDTSRAGARQALGALAERAHLAREVPAEPAATYPDRLGAYLQELAARLIPVGLHVAGEAPEPAAAAALLNAVGELGRPEWGGRSLPDLVGGPEQAARLVQLLVTAGPEAAGAAGQESAGWQRAAPLLTELLDNLRADRELPALLRALDGGYIPPGPGGDPVRNPRVLPAGRNLHALDPWRVPTAAAWQAGRLAADRLLERMAAAGGAPGAVALVLWGSDNIKTGGEGIAQALWLLGAEPVAGSLGRMSRVRLVPLAELGRPRLDVVVTCSGIFRDLFPGAMQLLQEAVSLAARADEPEQQNHVRRHVRQLAAELGVSLAEAALRVFAARPGHYGTGVNYAVDQGAWRDGGDLARTYVGRMGYAYDAGGQAREAGRVLRGALRRAGATLQNVDSSEVSLGDVDHYFEHLGGLTAAVAAARGGAPEAWVVDSTTGKLQVRTLPEALRVEVRTRLLNPRWYEGMLRHGFQGVSEVATRLDNAYGWLATTGQVDGWALDEASDTFLLDGAMRDRLARLNPWATQRMAARLLEAAGRGLWQTDARRLDALRGALAQIEDAVEGLGVG